MLNVALAWLRLAQQTEALDEADSPPTRARAVEQLRSRPR